MEPLSDELTAEELARAAIGRRAPLKSFLLDQAGRGRDREHLRRRGAPSRPAAPCCRPPARWSPEDCEGLRAAIVETLEAGAGERRRVDRRLPRRAWREGSMQDEFLVHTRAGKPCPRCGAGIRRIVVGGRSTYFCPACQRRLRGAVPEGGDERRSAPAGFSIGHLTNAEGETGCTVVIPPAGPRGVDVRGGGPGTRETDKIGPLGGTTKDRPWRSRRQRVRPRGRRRRRPMARGARLGYGPAGRCPSCRPRSSTTSPRATRRRGRTPTPDTRACEAAEEGVPERGRVGAGTGTAVGQDPRARALDQGRRRVRRGDDGGGSRRGARRS